MRSSQGAMLAAVLVIHLLGLGRLPAALLESVSPPSGLPGSEVTIQGRFAPGSSYSIRLNGESASGLSVGETTLSFIVPANATSGLIELTEDGEIQNFPIPFMVSREISGTLTPPTGISPDGFKVLGGEGVTTTAANGSFTTIVSTGKPTLL